VAVARSQDEAERLRRGEDVTRRTEETEQEAAPAIAEEAFFEPEVVEARHAREATEEEAAEKEEKK
jgi:large subunit ribosomal protein L9